jgi:light-independent protochlorophyllide reductase subunit B
MQLALWTYEGPPHVGAMRIATAMKDVHFCLHAPQGDTYADLLFTMIERRDRRPPVTYTTFQARDLGGDTATLFKTSVREAYERFKPALIMVGGSCTAELIQDDPGGLGETLGLPVPIVKLEFSAYQRRETHGAAETFLRLVRACAVAGERVPGSCNILGPAALGFRHRDDLEEIKRLLASMGVTVNVVAPQDATVADLARLPEAAFNIVLYPKIWAALCEHSADWGGGDERFLCSRRSFGWRCCARTNGAAWVVCAVGGFDVSHGQKSVCVWGCDPCDGDGAGGFRGVGL